MIYGSLVATAVFNIQQIIRISWHRVALHMQTMNSKGFNKSESTVCDADNMQTNTWRCKSCLCLLNGCRDWFAAVDSVWTVLKALHHVSSGVFLLFYLTLTVMNAWKHKGSVFCRSAVASNVTAFPKMTEMYWEPQLRPNIKIVYHFGLTWNNNNSLCSLVHWTFSLMSENMEE